MNKLLKIGIPIIGAFLGYIIGNYIPFDLLAPHFEEEPLKKVEYYRLLVQILSAIITFTAVLVALFKDDLREIWKKPIVKFIEPDQMTIEDLNSALESETVNDTPIANRYLSRILVENSGNVPVLNAEIYLDKLTFTPKDSTISQNIESSSSAIKWNGSAINAIIIPPGGKKVVNIVEIIPPVKTSTPESQKIKTPAQLSIGEIKNTKEQTKGIWSAKFSLYAQNHKPSSFTIEIEWNGIWKTRLAEFNNQYKITKTA